MPFLLLPEMRRHFHETGSLEVEALFPKKLLLELGDTIKALFPLEKGGFKERYGKGRDLFRTFEPVRRLEMRKEVISFISDLAGTRFLHLACDQLFDWTMEAPEAPLFFSPLSSFADYMSIRPLIMGMLVALEGEGPQLSAPFPSKPGNVTFFNPEIPFDWEKETPKDRSFLFVGYAPRGATVHFNPKDPHSHLLKRMDYQEGTPIEAKTHPLFRL